MKAWQDQSPVLSCARGAYRSRCTSSSGNRTNKDRAEHGCPAIEAGSRFAQATINESLRRADQKLECQPAVRHGLGADGSYQSKFFPNDGDSAHHIRQFLTRRPPGGLTESTVGGKGEFFRGH